MLVSRFQREGYHKELRVSHRFLGDNGSKTVFDWLATNGRSSANCAMDDGSSPPWLLTNIDLNDVSMRNAGFEALTQYLHAVKTWSEGHGPQKYSGIGRVCLRYNHIQGSKKHAEDFLSSLAYSRTPKWSPSGVLSLVFSNNPLSVEFRRAFFTMLPDALPHLLELKLDMTGLSTSDGLALARFIGGDQNHQPSKLVRLTASANSLGQVGVAAIVEACRRSYSIEHVELYANGVDDPAEEEDPEDYMPGRPFERSNIGEDDDPLQGLEVANGISERVRGSGCGWETLERTLRRFLVRNMHLKTMVSREALDLLRYSRILLLHGSLKNGCQSPRSSPPFSFAAIPNEIQQNILCKLAPLLSTTQHLSVIRYATQKSTLPPLPTLTLPDREVKPRDMPLVTSSGPGPRAGSLARGPPTITQRGHCLPPPTPTLGTTKTIPVTVYPFPPFASGKQPFHSLAFPLSLAMNTRGSKRKSLSAPGDTPATAGDTLPPPGPDPAAARAVKKRRIVKGSLRLVSAMPIDVLFEIFGHLLPLDLLNLSRTSKDFRQLLMSKSSASVWMQCRRNVPDLPDCPDDLSEPQYAELLFGKACYKCGKNHAYNTVSYAARSRFCGKCLATTYTRYKFNHNDDPRLLHIVPSVKKPGERRPLYDKALYTKWEAEMRQLKPEDAEKWITAKTEERERIVEHAAACERWHESRESAKEAEINALVRDRLKLVRERIPALGWQEELDELPDFSLGPEYDSRIVKICAKPLNQKAWGQIDTILNQLMGILRMVRLEFQTFLRTESAIEHLDTLRDDTVASLPQVEPYIPLVELVRHPKVVDALDRYAKDRALDTDIFDFISTEFQRLHDDWVGEKAKELVELVRRTHNRPSGRRSGWTLWDWDWDSDEEEEISQPQEPVNPVFDPTGHIDLDDADECRHFLSRSTISFKCDNCVTRGMRFPAVLSHRCAYEVDDFYHLIPVGSRNAVEDLVAEIAQQSPFNTLDGPITYDASRYALRCRFVELCGHDPTTATVADMDNVVVECLMCKTSHSGDMTIKAMLGSRAMLHLSSLDHWMISNQDNRPASDLFKLLDESDVPRAKKAILEAAAKTLSVPVSDPDHWQISRSWRICCTRCPAVGTRMAMQRHFHDTHGSLPSKGDLKIGINSLGETFTPPMVDLLAHPPVVIPGEVDLS